MPKRKSIAQYEIVKELGRGGFAAVYRARHTRMGREVALKVLHSVPTGEAAFVQRFQQEASVAAGLRHPNIVPVYDFGDADGVLYLAMALVGEGRTLRHLLAEQGPLSPEVALPILAQLADALDYLHGGDPALIHRDVKPANVMMERRGDNWWAILTDFGLVRSLESSAELTKSGATLGTPAYMAPEQAEPGKWGEITPLTDVYALGVVAYEMLAGRVPFPGEGLTVLHAHAYEPPPSPLQFIPDLGDDLGAALLRALAKPPAERYPGAGAFVRALQEVSQARTVASQREATLEQLAAQARELLDAGEWLEALDCCTQMVRLDPDRPAALEMLTAAKEGLDRERAEAVARRRLEERYTEGVLLLGESAWKQAIAALEEVAAGNPDFRDVQEKLVQARDELRRAQWYDEAIGHGEAERWDQACHTWLQVLRGRLDYRDGEAAQRLLDSVDGLLGQLDTMRETLTRQEHDLGQAREALVLYDALAAAVGDRDWERAVEVGEKLLQMKPDLITQVLALVHAGQNIDALQVLSSALEADPTLVTGWVLMGILADNAMVAQSCLGQALALDPEHELAQAGLDWMYAHPDQIPTHLIESLTALSPETLPSAEVAALLAEGGDPQDDKVMVRVPAGSFLYGEGKREEEQPEFWIDKSPVTNAEYARFVATTGHAPPQHWWGKTPPQEIADHPVVYVTWHDAVAYAEWAGKRLPTEEEWEKAARGTDGREYPWGNWAAGRCNTKEAGVGGTTPVGQYSPGGDSPYGGVDMVGNVWEWTASEHKQGGRVLRGGSWLSYQVFARCSYRRRGDPADSNVDVGFRCVSPTLS